MIARELLVKLGFNIDEKKLSQFSGNVENLKQRINELQSRLGQPLTPNIDTAKLIAYNKLNHITFNQFQDIEELKKREQLRADKEPKKIKQKIKQLKLLKQQIQANTLAYQRNARAAQAANQILARHVTRYARRYGFIISAASLLAFRNTLKSAEKFQKGERDKNSAGFSRKQILNVNRFNSSLTQTRRIISSLRDRFITGLLPAFKEHLDQLNYWLIANKKLVQTKFKGFINGVSDAFKTLAQALKGVNYVVENIGGWENVLKAVFGIALLSLVIRLGVFFIRLAKAIAFAAVTLNGWRLALLAFLEFNPVVLAITAIAAALAFLANELYVTWKGGDSLINRLMPTKEFFESWLGTLEKIKEWFNKKWTNNSPISGALKSLQKRFSPEPQETEYVGKFNGLNVYKVTGNSRLLPPETIASGSTSNNTQNKSVVTNKNNINISVNLPQTSTDAQALEVVEKIQGAIEEQGRKDDLDTLNAVGAY